MNIKHAFLAINFTLAACGGGTSVQPPIQPARSNVVAFMGDSITQYWGPYMPVASDFTTLDVGIHGQTSTQMLARFQIDVIDATPAVGIVIIDAGINDLQIDGVANGSAEALENIATMAHMATQAGIRVVVASLMLASCGTTSCGSPADIEAFNTKLIYLAQANDYLYADYFDAMLNTDGTQALSLYIDGVHPTEEGYRRMWAVIDPLINEDL